MYTLLTLETPLWISLILTTLLFIALWKLITVKTYLNFLQVHSQKEKELSEQKIEAISQLQTRMVESFKALSNDALKGNSDSFIHLAKASLSAWQSEAVGDLKRRQDSFEAFVKPIRETIEKMESKLQDFEKYRSISESKLSDQLVKLQYETTQLVRALRQPHVRGRWGEVQLKRVVEMAGMLEHCDFAQQVEAFKDDERRRPDMIVRLPGGKNVVIDAKTPLQAYLDAHETVDEEIRVTKFKEHARHVRQHIEELSKKSYWDQFQPTPEFAVLFLPGEHFFSAALEHDPSLIEKGVDQKVILATPTTLIALLRAVAYGWNQERLAENAQEFSSAGRLLYERLHIFSDHLSGIKKGLEQAVKAYNQCVGSYESRVMVAARKLHDLGAGGEKEAISPDMIEVACRQLSTESA